MRNGKRIADCLGRRVENAFSLIELLVVIGIIALLASLIFPAISMVKGNARKTQAKAMAANLVMAIKQYETTYGLLPVSNDPNGDGSTADSDVDTPSTKEFIKDDATYDKLITILSQVAGPSGAITDGNLRKTRFLEVPSEYDTSTPYRDPWGNRFRIGIDSDYNKNVTGFTSTPLNGTVFVYSLGPDGDGATGNVPGGSASKGDDGGDPVKDVLSWK